MLFIDSVLQLLAPYNCLQCGREGLLLCEWCKPEVVSVVASSCYTCQKQTKDFAVCDSCRRKTALRHVWFTSYYKDLPKKLVAAAKYEQKRAGCRLMAEYLHTSLPYFAADTLIVPIPTAPRRVRERGFDHAAHMARVLAANRELECKTVLGRTGRLQQVGAPREQRIAQVKGMFYIRKPTVVTGATILLVDDVLTTGATLEEAARILKKAGARSVNAAVFARAQF